MTSRRRMPRRPSKRRMGESQGGRAKRRVYQAACDCSAVRTSSFSGITRPVAASVFDLPTVNVFLCTKSTWLHRSSRSLIAKTTIEIHYQGGVHVPTAEFPRFSQHPRLLVGTKRPPGEGGTRNRIDRSRSNLARIRSPWSPQRRSNNSTSSLIVFALAFSAIRPA